MHKSVIDDPDDKRLEAAVEWFARLRSSRVTAEDRVAFSAWIESNDLNKAAFDRIDLLWNDLEVLENLSIDLVSTKPESPLIHLREKWNMLAGPRLATAVMMLIIAVTVWLWVPVETDIQTASYSTGQGRHETVTLADGSKVYMNTQSEIVVKFDDDVRKVKLIQGEGLFEVQHETERDFVVVAGHGIIRAIGTVFNVNKVSDKTTITVLTGTVEVSVQTENGEVVKLLNTTEQISYRQSSGPEEVVRFESPEKVARVVSWQSGRLFYEAVPLEDVVAELNRYFSREIRIGDDNLRNIEVSAVLDIQDEETVIKAIERTFAIKAVEVSKDTTLLISNHNDKWTDYND